MPTVPRRDFCRGWQTRAIDIDHAGVGCTEFVNVFERVGIDLFCQRQAIAACFCQSDQLLEPCRPGGLEMDARSRFPDCPSNDGIQTEFVATAMHAKLEVSR